MTAPARVHTRARKGAGARRALVMQGILFQAGLAILLVFMALLSRDDARFRLMYLWSLIIPAGVAFVFYNAFQRSEKLNVDEAAAGERREGKRALGMLGALLTLWVAGLVAILFVF